MRSSAEPLLKTSKLKGRFGESAKEKKERMKAFSGSREMAFTVGKDTVGVGSYTTY